MVEEHRVHGLPDLVVAPEGERQVGDASGGQRPGKLGLYPSDGFYEVHGVARVFRNAGSYRKHAGVEDYVAGPESQLFREQPVGAGADFRLPSEARGLPLLVECHHHHGGSQLPGLPGFPEEAFFSFPEGDRVHDALALGVLEPGQDGVPMGGVHHYRRPGD